MQDYFLQSRGIAYRTNIFRPERKTLLFVHGLSGSLSAWYPYEKIFENNYNLITFDLRGHGLSSRPTRSGYAMQEFVEDIRVLLEHMRVERCSIVSHSFGTLIAMEFGRAHQGVVERNIFLAPAYGVHHFKISKLLANLGAALAMAPLRLRAYARTDYARFYPTPDYSVSRIGTDILNMGLRSYLRSLRVVFEQNYNPHWPELACPALLVHGSQDSIVPITHARELARVLKNSKIVELSGANHILVLNNIKEVAAEIEKFMQQ